MMSSACSSAGAARPSRLRSFCSGPVGEARSSRVFAGVYSWSHETTLLACVRSLYQSHRDHHCTRSFLVRSSRRRVGLGSTSPRSRPRTAQMSVANLSTTWSEGCNSKRGLGESSEQWPDQTDAVLLGIVNISGPPECIGLGSLPNTHSGVPGAGGALTDLHRCGACQEND